MPNSLITGVTGLIAHQRMLDVVSNNLANINTIGFKERRVHFSDLFYSSLRPATSSSADNIGGINPADVGTGVKVGQITTSAKQGNLEQTGEVLDMAIQGSGLFTLNNGQTNLYSRAGAFALDSNGYLVDPGTGFRVQRFGTIGEADGVNPGFQASGDSAIQIPFGASIPGETTTAIALRGNLNASATLPQAHALTTSSAFTSGGLPATNATLLNSLDSSTSPYVSGDSIQVYGVDFDGSPINVTIPVDGSTTVGDLTNAISSAFAGATASIDANGFVAITADTDGATRLDLSLSNVAGNSGGITFADHQFLTTTSGQNGGKYQTSVEVFDVRGGSHTVTLTLSKVSENVWDLVASMNAADGTITDNSVQSIQFNDDGSLLRVSGTGIGDSNLVIQFAGVSAPQTVALSFGADNSYEGVSQLATESGIATEQNGFAPGTLVGLNITSDGVLTGLATNGKRFSIAQLAIASFRNPQGLKSLGDNYYEESLNSGDVQLGTALSGDRGAVAAGQLETSNVEIALEFTRLIVAQRGFSANARTITVSADMLEELTGLIR